jgi:hypothetical protein
MTSAGEKHGGGGRSARFASSWAKYSSFRSFQLAFSVPGGKKRGVRCSQLEDDRDLNATS